MADNTIKAATAGRQFIAKDLQMKTFDERLLKAAIPGARLGAAIKETPPVVSLPQILTPQPVPPPFVPGASADNPFNDLPMPSPGDRIKAEDFKKLSQSLRVVYDAYLLSSALFGRSFGEVKLALASQQYEIQQAMTVFGNMIENLADDSLDSRKVIQVVPVEIGARRVSVILTEAVETRRFAPNLLGLSYGEASEKLRSVLGDVTFPSGSKAASQLVGLSLAEARDSFSK